SNGAIDVDGCAARDVRDDPVVDRTALLERCAGRRRDLRVVYPMKDLLGVHPEVRLKADTTNAPYERSVPLQADRSRHERMFCATVVRTVRAMESASRP